MFFVEPTSLYSRSSKLGYFLLIDVNGRVKIEDNADAKLF